MTDKSAYDTEKLDHLEPACLANYGLNEAPFSNLHDDRFLYLDAERAQRLNLLQHMTQYSNLLLIVQGERGVGKTSLLTRFIESKADNWYICDVTANAMMDAGQLLFQAAQGFGLQQLPQDSGELQEMLYATVAELHRQHQIPILVIDDAHELPKDALLAIFHLADAQVDNANLLRIILFAEPQIEKILNATDVRSLRERVTHTMEIPPLDEDTTSEYLKHRMAVAGFNGVSPFTPKMVKRIYKASGGVPEAINKLADETLAKGDFEGEEVEEFIVPATPRRQYKTAMLIGVAVIAISLVLVFLSWINRLFEDKPTQTKTLSIPLVETTPAIQPAPKPSTEAEPAPINSAAVGTQAPASVTAEKPSAQKKIIPLHAAPTPAPSPSQSVAPAPVTAPSNAVKQATPVTEKPASPPAIANTEAVTAPEPVAPPNPVTQSVHVQNVLPDPVPASNSPQTITLNGEGFTKETRVFVSWADRDHEIPPARVKLVNAQQLKVTLTVGTQHEKWQLHVTDAKHGNSNTLAFRVATPARLSQQANDWALSQEPGEFTLQLFSSHEKKNAETFIRRHKLGKQANIFISERKGKDWYSVVYGVYSDQAAARAATRTLPASLKSIKPWVRRFDAIQVSIKASHKSPQQQQKTVAKPATVFATALPKHGDSNQYASWLWSQDPSYFTLQLTGASELASVMKFQHKYAKLDGHAIYFHTRHNGRDWYAVVYGVYPTRQKASEAIKRLPSALQKASPWIRSFASIQAEMARAE